MSDDPQIFAKLLFSGKRFDEHVLPLQALPELAAYSELVLDVARSVYLRKHPGRMRVPKGFNSRLKLGLRSVSPGSALSPIERLRGGDLFAPLTDEFTEARDLISEAVDALSSARPLPAAFPRASLPRFDRFGRGLLPTEGIALCLPDQDTGPRYTMSIRRQLLLTDSDTYHAEVQLQGEVVGVTLKSWTFQLQAEDCIHSIPFPHHYEKLLTRALHNHGRIDLQVSAIGEYDRSDSLLTVGEVLDLTIVDSLRFFDTSLADVQRVEAGWLDGTGAAPTAEALHSSAQLRTALTRFPAIAVPHLYPTPEGGVQAEWSSDDSLQVTLCIDPDGSCFVTWSRDESGVKDLTIASPDVSPNALAKVIEQTSLDRLPDE